MFRFFIPILLILNFTYAKQPQFAFIGLVGSSDTISLDSSTQMNDEKSSAFGLRFGKQSQDYRTVFTLDGNSDYQAISVEADVFLLDNIFGLPEIRPYLGGTLGYMYYDKDKLDSYSANIPVDTNSSNKIENDGAYYGVNVGFVLYATDTLDIDLSYHYYFVDQIDLLDTMHGFSFSLHYFY